MSTEAFYRDVVDPLRKLANREKDAGAEMFMGWPDRWYVDRKVRCERGHVSRTVLKSEGLGRAACLAGGCGGHVVMTFPEDVDGPLVLPT